MSAIENKVLGIKNIKEKKKNETLDYFSDSYIWDVYKEGCGHSLFNGKMAYEMMSATAKDKVKKGSKKVTSDDFIFTLKG